LIRFNQSGQRSWRRNQGPVEGDFYGLRDWRSGDSRRWIHWRSSAKRQELLVRQFEQHRSQDFVVLLDLFQRPGALSENHAERLVETAISFVATVLSEHCRRGGGRLTLGLAGTNPRLMRGTASSAWLDEALELLAEAAPTNRDELTGLLPEALSRTSLGDRVMIVSLCPTDLFDAERFPHIDSDDPLRASLRQAIVLDVSQPSFADVFRYGDETAEEESPSEVR
jgi:uncharacterized protein (DUF58 family)